MFIYLKNNPAKFHPDPIRNDGAWGFFDECRHNSMEKNNTYNRRSSDMEMKSVRRPKIS